MARFEDFKVQVSSIKVQTLLPDLGTGYCTACTARQWQWQFEATSYSGAGDAGIKSFLLDVAVDLSRRPFR